MRGIKIVLRFLLGLNILVSLALLLSCLSPYLSPEHFWWFGFLGLGFYLLLLVNVVFGIWWLLVKWKWAGVSLVALLVSSSSIGNFISLTQVNTGGENEVSIMSYNVKTFDLYNWSNNVESKEKMLEAILQAKPDVLCLQEFYTDNTMAFNTLRKLEEDYPYHYFEKTFTQRSNRHWGIATFSKFPIVEEKELVFENSRYNLGIRTDLLIRDDTVSIFNVHLQSIHFAPEDYNYMEGGELNNMSSFLEIVKKLKQAFKKRAVQAQLVRKAMDENKHAAVLCGDFNDSPNSYAYQVLSSDMKDTFKEAGLGVGQTYGGPMPGLRIDFILTDPAISVNSHKVIDAHYSDHYPVYSSFSLE